MADDARNTVHKWQDVIRERELAQKRRVAPGWLDVEQRILVPERKAGSGEAAGPVEQGGARKGGVVRAKGLMDVDMSEERDSDTVGEELDRAFGGMGLT